MVAVVREERFVRVDRSCNRSTELVVIASGRELGHRGEYEGKDGHGGTNLNARTQATNEERAGGLANLVPNVEAKQRADSTSQGHWTQLSSKRPSGSVDGRSRRRGPTRP